jgi:hypothetical protein
MYQIGFVCEDKEQAMKLRKIVMEFFESEQEVQGDE